MTTYSGLCSRSSLSPQAKGGQREYTGLAGSVIAEVMAAFHSSEGHVNGR